MTADAIIDALEATWPPASSRRLGPWLLRDGKGGGKRVSATTLLGDFTTTAIADAEAAMRMIGDTMLFQLRPEDHALDASLAKRGYKLLDPVTLYSLKLHEFPTGEPPPMTTFLHWPPLGIAKDLWLEGGIGPDRLAVMHRVKGPKCALLGRIADRASGVAFVAVHERIAMLHGLEVTPSLRRKGTARHLLQAAAVWARGQGAAELALAVTTANAAARTLYASFGMKVVGHYHYRQF